MAPGAFRGMACFISGAIRGEVLDDAVQFRMGRPAGWNVPLHAVWHGQSLSLDRPRCRSGLSLPDRPWPGFTSACAFSPTVCEPVFSRFRAPELARPFIRSSPARQCAIGLKDCRRQNLTRNCGLRNGSGSAHREIRLACGSHARFTTAKRRSMPHLKSCAALPHMHKPSLRRLLLATCPDHLHSTPF